MHKALDEYLRRYAEERRQEVLRTAAGLWAERSDRSQVDAARATLDRRFSRCLPSVRLGKRVDR